MSAKTYDLAELLSRASALASAGDPDIADVAGAALALAACHSAIEEALEPLKKIIRAAGQQERKSPDDLVEYDGDSPEGHPAGVVSVNFQAPRATLSKSASTEKMQKILGPELDLYFTTKLVVEPRRDFANVCRARQALHPVEVSAAMRYVDLVEPVPRVGFRPLPSVSPVK